MAGETRMKVLFYGHVGDGHNLNQWSTTKPLHISISVTVQSKHSYPKTKGQGCQESKPEGCR